MSPATIDSCYLLMNILVVFAAVAFIKAEAPRRLRRLAFLPLIRWPAPERLCLTFPVVVTLSLLLRPLCVFCFGILNSPSETQEI